MKVLRQLNPVFKGLPDPRSLRNQKHPFLSLMSIGLLSTLSGHESFSGMADFARCHFDRLSRLLDLPNELPSHDTFQRIFDALDPEAFLSCFSLFTQSLADSIKGVTALDGKKIRNSGKQGHQLHIVSAWCEENRLVLAQTVCKGAVGSELSGMKQLLDMLDLEGRIITVDALGCQKSMAQKIAHLKPLSRCFVAIGTS